MRINNLKNHKVMATEDFADANSYQTNKKYPFYRGLKNALIEMGLSPSSWQVLDKVGAAILTDDFMYRRLKSCIEEEQNCMILGAPGWGKSYVVEDIAKELGIPVVKLNVLGKQSYQITGIPEVIEDEATSKLLEGRVKDGTRRQFTQETVPQIVTQIFKAYNENNGKPVLLFLDEVTRYNPSIQNMLLGITHPTKKEYNETYDLNEVIHCVVAAGNLATLDGARGASGGIVPLEDALVSRFSPNLFIAPIDWAAGSEAVYQSLKDLRDNAKSQKKRDGAQLALEVFERVKGQINDDAIVGIAPENDVDGNTDVLSPRTLTTFCVGSIPQLINVLRQQKHDKLQRYFKTPSLAVEGNDLRSYFQVGLEPGVKAMILKAIVSIVDPTIGNSVEVTSGNMEAMDKGIENLINKIRQKLEDGAGILGLSGGKPAIILAEGIPPIEIGEDNNTSEDIASKIIHVVKGLAVSKKLDSEFDLSDKITTEMIDSARSRIQKEIAPLVEEIIKGELR